MFCPPRGAKKGISLWTNTSVQRCLYPLFQNQSPHFLLSSLFWKLSQPLGQDQQNSKQTYCRLPIIFVSIPKGFSLQILSWISPEPVYSAMVAESFKFIVLRLLQIHLWIKKFVHFYSCPQAKLSPRFLSLSPGRGELRILPGQRFLKIFFPDQKEGGKDYGWKNYQNQQWYWSQVLINSTIFATFSLCEGSLI